MLIDDVKIHIKAGKGGDGMVAFNKNMLSLGPTGGDGGNGGNVYFEGTSNIGALSQFRNKKDFSAENGKAGQQQRKTGGDGSDITLKIPVGSIIYNASTGEVITEIEKIGGRILLAKGGRGGNGNFFFRSSTNTSPKESTSGTPGEELDLRIELKLIADVGFIGFPNVGKSSLLNELTNAKSKVANYKFTTLEPNLGVYYELILADIPGLIEGASTGKGLGIKFLRHIERTKMFFHLISAQAENPDKEYEAIREELKLYNPALLKKPEYIFLSKSDEIPEEELKEKMKELKKKNKSVIPISILDESSMKKVSKILSEIIEIKKAS